MASTITIICPECDQQMKASDQVIGKKIRCKGCSAVFPAKAATAKPAGPKKAAPKKDDDDEDASPYGITEDTFTPRCPQCANEMESREAVVCLYCGYNTVMRTQKRARAKSATSRGGTCSSGFCPESCAFSPSSS